MQGCFYGEVFVSDAVRSSSAVTRARIYYDYPKSEEPGTNKTNYMEMEIVDYVNTTAYNTAATILIKSNTSQQKIETSSSSNCLSSSIFQFGLILRVSAMVFSLIVVEG